LAQIQDIPIHIPRLLASLADKDAIALQVLTGTDEHDPTRTVDSYEDAWWKDLEPSALEKEEIVNLWQKNKDSHLEQVGHDCLVYISISQ
jgi:hypothetical protein